jgi:signal transduction histidine kinase
MAGLARALVGLAIAGLILGTYYIVEVVSDVRGSASGLVLAATVGWPFIGAGLIAWWRRPGNRCGALMTAIGFAWFAAGLEGADSSALFTIGLVFELVPIALMVHLLLVFPSGVLTRGGTIVATLMYLLATIGQAPIYLFGPGDGVAYYHCDLPAGCPQSVLLIADNPDVVNLTLTIRSALVAVVLLIAAALLVRRMVRAGPALRRYLAIVLVPGIVATLVIGVVGAVPFRHLDVPSTVPTTLTRAGNVVLEFLPFLFMGALIAGGFARVGRLEEFLGELGSRSIGAAALQAEVANALGDRTVALHYWLPKERRYVDSEGRPAELPPGGDERSALIIERHGRRVGAVTHAGWLRGEPELLATVAGACALAMETQRLDAELRASLREVRRSRARIVEAADRERRRISRDLHDGVQQRLMGLALKAELVRIAADDRAGVERAAAELHAGLDDLADELDRLTRGIMPAVLADDGLAEALADLARQSPLRVDLELGLPADRLPEKVESTAFFVIAEALANVVKHAGVREATVRVHDDDERVTITVTDRGAGGASSSAGTGLVGLADRVGAIGGELEVRSPPGEGTRLLVRLPRAASDDTTPVPSRSR